MNPKNVVGKNGRLENFLSKMRVTESMEIIVNDLSDLDAAAVRLIEFAGDRKKFLLNGEIGAGKTTFVKAIGRHLGVKDAITSPTFSLINEYPLEQAATGDSGSLYHIDLYRIESLQEAINIGITDYLDNSAYCFIEWPELVEGLLPDEVVKINIEILENSSRKVIFL